MTAFYALVAATTTATATATTTRQGMRRDWHGQTYTGDIWPKHFTIQQNADFENKYKNIPEEFYTRTGHLVVTPENFNTWLEAHKNVSFRFVLQEQFSGSGRFSLQCERFKLPVLFPVDLRYG